MTVKEFIEALSKCDPNAAVIACSSNFELRYEKCEARIRESRAQKRHETFRDAFDNEYYRTEIYREVLSRDDEGKPVVVIDA